MFKLINKNVVIKISENRKGNKNLQNTLDVAFAKLYTDRLEDKISKRNYDMMNEKFTAQQTKLIEEIRALEKAKVQEKDLNQECKKFVENISKYSDLDSLSRYVLNQLIDVIYVYEPVKDGDKTTQKVEIRYKFIGNISGIEI